MDTQTQVGWPPVIAAKVRGLTYTQVIYLVKEMDQVGSTAALRMIMAELAAEHRDWLYPPQSLLEQTIRNRAKTLLEEAPSLLHRALTDFEEKNRGRPVTRPHWSDTARSLLLGSM